MAVSMHLGLGIFVILALLLGIQSLVSLRDGFRFLRFVRSRLRKSLVDYAPPATVIIPVKGLEAGIENNLASFASQNYPSYQLVWVVADARDPAYPILQMLKRQRSAGSSLPGASGISIVVAGRSDERGEKVHNLLRGLDAAHPSTSVLVFADADAKAKADWLRSLVAPLADQKVTVSTGFRWYLPGQSFASRLRAAWDTSIATFLGDHDHNFAWGGSMAIRTTDFKRLGIAQKYWASTVSDDYAVTCAVREAGGRIHFEPRCLVATGGDSTFREFVRWANRQIIITRVYAPKLFRLGLAAHVLYAGTFLLGLFLLLNPDSGKTSDSVAGAVLISVLVLGIAKAWIRTLVARDLFPEETEAFDLDLNCYWRLTPLVPWLMLWNFSIAGLTRRIEWKGVKYHLRSDHEVEVLRRENR